MKITYNKAIITSEFASTKRRGAMMAAVFAMQGIGILVAAIISIIFLAIFKTAIYENQDNLDYVWRLCIGFGAIPGCLALYFRLTMPETPRYTVDIEKDFERANIDLKIITDGAQEQNLKINAEKTSKASSREFFKYFSKWKNFKILLATSMTWLV